MHNQPKGAKQFRLLLNGHVDVVPAKDNQFEPVIKDGLMFGRGTGDMKAGAACIMQAFNELAGQADYPLAISLVTDEEVGGFDGAGVQVAQGYNADFVLVAESTDLNLTYAAKGVCWFELHAEGKRGHGSRVWGYPSASERLLTALDVLREQYPMPEQEVWHTTINIAGINVPHEAANQIANRAAATIDCRFTPDDELFQTATSASEVRERLQELVGSDVTVAVKIFEQGVETPKDHPDVQRLAEVVKAQTSTATEFIREHGFTDIRFFTNNGAAGVVFGPQGDNHHGDNESVELSSVQQTYKIVSDFINSLT